MKTIEAIINEIKASEELQKKLVEAAKNNTIAEFLKELGCEATAEEFAAAAKAQSAELSDAELDAVAGGYNEDYFSTSADLFAADAPAMAEKQAELAYMQALHKAREEKASFPDMTAESISRDYPGLCQSVTQVLHNTDARVEELLQK